MSTHSRRNIESYRVVLHPTTLELVANWLVNGADLNEIDFMRASWCAAQYRMRRYMDLTFEPFAVDVTLVMAGQIMDEVTARQQAIIEQLAFVPDEGDEFRAYKREQTRLEADRKALQELFDKA